MLGSNPIINTTLLYTQMETAKTQTITLVERFKNAEEKVSTYHNGEEHRWYPEHQRMEYELGHLLSNEISAPYMLKYDNGVQLLEEYKEHFEWDNTYSVRAEWEISPSTYTNSYECSSVEEIKQYLNFQKHIETPDWEEEQVDCSINYGSDFTGEKDLEAVIRISNLRPKQPKQKYLLSVLAESEVEGSAVVKQLKTLFPTWEVLSITPND
jgi:hypothetical protein